MAQPVRIDWRKVPHGDQELCQRGRGWRVSRGRIGTAFVSASVSLIDLPAVIIFYFLKNSFVRIASGDKLTSDDGLGRYIVHPRVRICMGINRRVYSCAVSLGGTGGESLRSRDITRFGVKFVSYLHRRDFVFDWFIRVLASSFPVMGF